MNIFKGVFKSLAAEESVEIVWRDERTGLLGDGVEFDFSAMRHAVEDFDPPFIPKITVCAQMPTPEEVDKQHPGSIEFDEEGLTINLPISDRFTYTDKAITRVNRNLIHMLRFAEVVLDFQMFLPMEIAVKTVEMSYPLLMAEAYAQAKNYCIGHDELPIKAVAPAE